MKDIYIIHGKGPCGKTWFAQNVIYDENIDKYCWSKVTEFDFIEKYTGEQFYYKNLIVDDFPHMGKINYPEFTDLIFEYRNNFDNLFIICQDYDKYIKEFFCREISYKTSRYDNKAVRIHVLDFDNGENFNIREWR